MFISYLTRAQLFIRLPNHQPIYPYSVNIYVYVWAETCVYVGIYDCMYMYVRIYVCKAKVKLSRSVL
jgi:hypothetical protein